MADKYILEGHTPVLCNDPIKWAEWLKKADCQVASETHGNVRISTFFLGLDASISQIPGIGESSPVLFKTMVFGGENDRDQDWCETWDEAEEMHRQMCREVFGE